MKFVARDFFNRPCQFTLPLAHNINFGGFGWHKINYGENCFAEKKLNPAENVINSDRNTQKKTTYALKTPSVVALPFMYGVVYIIISN